MTFLQPWMLWALPIAALPIVIHLINRRRYQSTPWAAMMFLLAANRMTRGYTRLRRWAILATRVAVLATLILAIGRPLAGGLLQSFTGGAAGEHIVLIDRSPSMRARGQAGAATKLQTGLRQLADALETVGAGRVTLIDSNSVGPRELESPRRLLDSPDTGESDTTADLPAMMTAALDHIRDNQLGRTDVWIVSDLRRSDWRPRDGRWDSIRDELATFGRGVRVKLLAYPDAAVGNRNVRVTDARRVVEGDEAFASISIRVTAEDSALVPVTFEIDSSRSVVEVDCGGGFGELKQHRVPIADDVKRGFGRVSIPADGEPGDDDAFFVFDLAPPRRSVVVSGNQEVARVLSLAAEISADEDFQNEVQMFAPEATPAIQWNDVSLVLWHARIPRPDSPEALAITGMVDRGGRVIFFPADRPGGGIFGVRWGQSKQNRDGLSVASWRGETDLLAASLAGVSLPVGTLEIRRYAVVEGDATPLATFAGNDPLLARVPTRRGGVYFCATTPATEDSSLAADGVVLYVMIQRALSAGAAAAGNASDVIAGSLSRQRSDTWQRLAGRAGRLSSDYVFDAGVYSDGDRFVAINRDPAEDDPRTLPDATLNELTAGMVFTRIDSAAGQSRSLVEEVWRAFLIMMLVGMIGEAILCLPRRRVEPVAVSNFRTGAVA